MILSWKAQAGLKSFAVAASGTVTIQPKEHGFCILLYTPLSPLWLHLLSLQRAASSPTLIFSLPLIQPFPLPTWRLCLSFKWQFKSNKQTEIWKSKSKCFVLLNQKQSLRWEGCLLLSKNDLCVIILCGRVCVCVSLWMTRVPFVPVRHWLRASISPTLSLRNT